MQLKSNKASIGAKRWTLKFAWFPKEVGSKGTIVWFEKYVSEQMYDMWRVPGPGWKGKRTAFGWREIKAWMWSGKGTSILINE